MRSGVSVLVSAAAGAVGGALVMLLAVNSQQVAQLPTGEVAQAVPSYEEAVIEAVQTANPAVVSIVITQDVPIVEQYFEDAPASPFTPWQFRVPQFRQRGTEQREVGGGSGFLISDDGMIVTNRHVVDLEDAGYTVFTNDGTQYDAEVVARDPVNDLAILKIAGSGLPFLELDNSEALQVGQTVIAIGNALSEFRNTVSVGVVSGLSRSILAGTGAGQAEQLDEVIQTDAAINPGNSGGPLLNLNGRVVGVNVAVALGSQNVGFALPSNLVRDAISSVDQTGRIVRPFLGVRYTMITPALAETENLPVGDGALVIGGEGADAVVPGSPAEQAGLTAGDIILNINDAPLNEQNTLARVIRSMTAGDTARLHILRDGQEQQVAVTLGEAPTDND